MIELVTFESRSLGDRVKRAIQLESSAIKLGNVHPTASFHDLNYHHFELASEVIGQTIDRLQKEPVGTLVFEATQAMMQVVKTNTSLGTILLLGPLVVAWREALGYESLGADEEPSLTTIRSVLAGVLSKLNERDSEQIYEAIRIAKAGGLGTRATMDVHGKAPLRIQDAMRIASEWDDIALQYATNFDLVFEIAHRLQCKKELSLGWLDAIRQIQLELLSERVDSLIARKRGLEFAREIKSRVKNVRASGEFGSPVFELAWGELDQQMRDESHGGNPGTIADLIATALFLR